MFVSIVKFGNNAETVLSYKKTSDADFWEKISGIFADDMIPDGGTNLTAGLKMGYDLIERGPGKLDIAACRAER